MPSGRERLTLPACGSRIVVAAASKLVLVPILAERTLFSTWTIIHPRRLIVPFAVAVKHQSYQSAPNYK
jgi:hypothetical protein